MRSPEEGGVEAEVEHHVEAVEGQPGQHEHHHHPHQQQDCPRLLPPLTVSRPINVSKKFRGIFHDNIEILEIEMLVRKDLH